MKRDPESGRAGKFFISGSGFYYYTGKIFDMIVVSALWLIGSLPVVTAGTSFSALYAASSRSIRRDIGTFSGEFWKSWRRDLKSSLPLWLIFAGGIFLLLLNTGIIWKVTFGLLRLFLLMFYIVCIALVVAAMVYAFPALSRFDMPFGWILKLSFYMVFRYLPTTLLLLALTAAGYFLVLFWPYLALIVPGVLGCMISSLVDPLLEKHMPQEEK